MNSIFQAVNDMFAFVVPIADFLWDFPTNCSWWSSIPILGQYSLGIIFLLGCGIYFTFRLRFVQIKNFKTGIKLLNPRIKTDVGATPLQSFLVSMAARVGAGNIVGVTGAITLGGPGAIFWMWISALFGMATAFAEATLAQLYKERNGDEYVGGFVFYIRKVWDNRLWIGTGMTILYLLYNLLSIPVHTFHVFTATSSIVNEITGSTPDVNSTAYYIIAVAIVVIMIIIALGGIRRMISFADTAVPFMAFLFIGVSLMLIIINFDKIPAFFASVFIQAFKPSSVFGGIFGVTLANGLKRALLSNEAGMGTATQASSIAEQSHPCQQGFVQSIGVFVDTIIICSLTGFVVAAGAVWNDSSLDWNTLKADKIGTFIASIKELVPWDGAFESVIVILMVLAFGLFAFTTLVCDLTYSEIAANAISQSKSFLRFIKILFAGIFVPIGVLTVLAGLQLDNLWYVSDLINIVLVFINVPTLFAARKTISAVYKNYLDNPNRRFVSKDVGIESDVWTEEAAAAREIKRR